MSHVQVRKKDLIGTFDGLVSLFYLSLKFPAVSLREPLTFKVILVILIVCFPLYMRLYW